MQAQACRFGLWVTALLALTSGCATFRPPQTAHRQQATPEQQQWWEEHRGGAKYVPGKGYYVEGTSGYFDDQGRPMPTDGLESAYEEAEPEQTDFLASLSPKNTYLRFKKLIGKGPSEPKARQAFEEGQALYREGKYKEAAEKFAIAYDRWPDSPLEEEALYMAGECAFFADRYTKADDAYALLVKKYSGTQYLDKVIARRFAIARYWEQHHRAEPHYALTPNLVDKTRPIFDTHGHALRVYDRIRLDDPTGPLADDSVMATANAHFVQAHYEDADYYYTLLRTEYPKSEHQYQAHLLGLQAKLRKYQGPDYEGSPLVEADEVATQLLAQFPAELGPEREKIIQDRAEIRAQQALRDYQIASYYHKGEYYGASRIYYENIVKQYPDTRLAQEARSKLEAVRGQPDVPVDNFEWLTNVFPSSSKSGPTIALQPDPKTTLR